jgi:hypothetical protein
MLSQVTRVTAPQHVTRATHRTACAHLNVAWVLQATLRSQCLRPGRTQATGADSSCEMRRGRRRMHAAPQARAAYLQLIGAAGEEVGEVLVITLHGANNHMYAT